MTLHVSHWSTPATPRPRFVVYSGGEFSCWTCGRCSLETLSSMNPAQRSFRCPDGSSVLAQGTPPAISSASFVAGPQERSRHCMCMNTVYATFLWLRPPSAPSPPSPQMVSRHLVIPPSRLWNGLGLELACGMFGWSGRSACDHAPLPLCGTAGALELRSLVPLSLAPLFVEQGPYIYIYIYIYILYYNIVQYNII